jgi:hypothetical protein
MTFAAPLVKCPLFNVLNHIAFFDKFRCRGEGPAAGALPVLDALAFGARAVSRTAGVEGWDGDFGAGTQGSLDPESFPGESTAWPICYMHAIRAKMSRFGAKNVRPLALGETFENIQNFRNFSATFHAICCLT